MTTLPFRKLKSHSFNGKKFKFKWRKPPKAHGLCDCPDNPPKLRKIYVNPDSTGEEFLELLLHESLHAEQWYLEEDTVKRIARNLSDLLTKAGYRMVDSDGNIVNHIKGEPPYYQLES